MKPMSFSPTVTTLCFRDFDSSSFEHVFVGEYRDDSFIGLHNWVQIYLQEKAGKLDYHGYFRRETVLVLSCYPKPYLINTPWRYSFSKVKVAFNKYYLILFIPPQTKFERGYYPGI